MAARELNPATPIYRQATLRSVASEGDDRVFDAMGVPYGVVIEHALGPEQFAPGSVTLARNPKLCWRHGEVVGRITAGGDTETGFEITGKVSDTALGRDAWELVRDGTIDSVSIGFHPKEWTYDADQDLLTFTSVEAFEFSLVPWPAYDEALINPDTLRATKPPLSKENLIMDPDTEMPSRAEFDALTDALTDLQRSIVPAPAAPVADTRSPAAVLRAVASGDEATIAQVNDLMSRDFTGGTTADAITKPAWVGDLSKLVDDANPLMGLFATGTLPATGNAVEYGQIKTNAVKVSKQAAEGDPLVHGKMAFETKTAPVHTYGGYTTLSIQAIERSSNAVLDMHLRAQALAAGVNLAKEFAAHFTAAVSAQAARAVTVTAWNSWQAWLGAIIDAAKKLKPLGLPLDGLIMDETAFKALGSMADSDGRPILATNGDGSNTVGSLSLPLSGRILTVPVMCNLDAPSGEVAFYSKQAIRSYTSGMARLQNTNAINLSRDFSVYQYAAFADEMPQGIVPVKVGAAG